MVYRNNSLTLRKGLFSDLITKVFIITGTLSSVKKKTTEVSAPRSNINADVKPLNVTDHLKVDNAITNHLN